MSLELFQARRDDANLATIKACSLELLRSELEALGGNGVRNEYPLTEIPPRFHRDPKRSLARKRSSRWAVVRRGEPG